MSQSRSKPVFANVYWFPLAAIHSALILPWSVAGQLGWWPAPPGLRVSWGHGHEMLFGFALAVMTGYLLGPQPRRDILAMIGLWLLARIAFLGWPGNPAAALLNFAFVLVLAWKTVPVFLKTAKKWRNKAVGVIVLGLCFSIATFHLAIGMDDRVLLARRMLLEAILLLSALMFFMGGRMLAPAIAGHMQDKGRALDARVQPEFEAAVLLLLAALLLLNLLPVAWVSTVEALLLFACAVLTLIRMLRWQIWHCLDRPDFLALLTGYGWLVAGWTQIGWSLLGGPLALSSAFHAITVGALGTLSSNVMIRTRMLRCLKDPNAWPWVYLLAVPVSIAAVLRLTITGLPYDTALLLAASLWSAAFAALFLLLMMLGTKEKRR